MKFKPLLLLSIKAYQRMLAPLLHKMGVRCRFHPSCSNYAMAAINKYDLRTALRLTIKRLMRCNKYNFDSYIDYP